MRETWVLCLMAGISCGRSEADLLTPACGPPSSGAPSACSVVWPNTDSKANSDPWLPAHHDGIVSLHPRLLVLHFYNPMSRNDARALIDKEIAALAEGSRYHAYRDSSAPVFLQYDVVKVVDLTDHPPAPGWEHPSSSLLPVTPEGAFDTAKLFSDEFTDHYDLYNPNDPSRRLSLCQLFEQGIVNEVWLHTGEGRPRGPELVLQRRQVYDEAGNAIAGSFRTTIGSEVLDTVACPVTIRMSALVPSRGVGCDLQAHGFGIEAMTRSIPYLDDNARAFFNHDMRSRFGTRFNGWNDLCDAQYTPCVDYPSPTTAVGFYDDGTSWRIDPFRQGCGGADFPPNARYRWDFSNEQQVDARCAHYGMRDGEGGQDIYEPYSYPKINTHEGFDDCGGEWQLFWRQSMPGLQNPARANDGAPMKNWWPFLFY